MELPGWYKDVYHVSLFPQSEQEYWKRVKEHVLERDGFRCQACQRRGTKKMLTVHHITARAEGGNEELDNLITLHYVCHDYVEAQGFRSAREIMGCTRYIDRRELQSVVLDADIPAEPERVVESAPTYDDNAAIVCPCGIHHIRSKSEIGKKVTTIKCACGVGVYQDGKWSWSKPKPKNVENRPVPIKNRKMEHAPVVEVCPFCFRLYHRRRMDRSRNSYIIRCECGAQAIRRTRENTLQWFGYFMLRRDVVKRGQ